MIIKNSDYYPLTKNEKVLREVLRVLLFIIVIVNLYGMYNQDKGINQDHFLVPVFCTAAEIFFMIYIFNAFTTGNLVRRWANDGILTFLFNLIKSKRSTSDEKTMELATKGFGIFGVIVFITVILLELYYYFF